AGHNLGPAAPMDKSMEDARAALCASSNKGADITKRLRKASEQEMTHKNPTLRQSAEAHEKQQQQQQPTRPKPKGPERLALDGKKWFVENFTGRRDLTITDTQMTQSVVIYRCDDCLVSVKGKVNSITVDS